MSFFIIAWLCFLKLSNGVLYTTPEQTHIAVGETLDQMIIVWNTVNDTDDTRVIYGPGTKMTLQEVGTSSIFVDSSAGPRSQYVHKVILKGLAPDTFYTYMVGSKYYGYSDVFNFKTWPAGYNWSPSLVLYGDLGNVNPQSLPRLQVDAASGMYDAILHVGDFAYDMNTDASRVGDEFMRQIEPLASNLPYMTCPGNHESANNFSNYRNRFSMPGDDNKRMYYSFNMGPIHFISLSTELIFYLYYGLVPVVEHYNWLENDLREANKPENRAKQPWIITFGHRPMYCSNNDTDDCTHHESLVRIGIPFLHLLAWEPLFYKYGVDIALWAHEHSYERLWPVYNREVLNGSYKAPYTNPKAPVHIITGSAGCYSRHDPFDTDVEDWSAFRSEDYGYTRMKVFNSTHVSIKQVSDDQGGAIIDSIMVIKDTHGSYPKYTKPFKAAGNPYKELWKTFLNFGKDNVDNLP